MELRKPKGSERISSLLRGLFGAKKMQLLHSVWKLLRHDGVFALICYLDLFSMKIIWKTLELADWKVASFDPSIVFSCIFLVVAACVLFSFVFLFPNMPLTYWGSLGDTLRGARPGHNPFGSASIVWTLMREMFQMGVECIQTHLRISI